MAGPPASIRSAWCNEPGTQIAKLHLDSFIAASARDPFTARIVVVDTGDGRGPPNTYIPCCQGAEIRSLFTFLPAPGTGVRITA